MYKQMTYFDFFTSFPGKLKKIFKYLAFIK